MQFNKPTVATLLLLIFFSINYNLLAQNETPFPVPSGNPNQLFYLQRTENINTVIYEINQENGNLNTENPIHVFWIMYTNGGKHENLSEMEKDFVYGVKIKSVGKNACQFTLVAYPKIILQLAKDTNQKYHVYATPSNKQIIVNRVYIKVKEGHFKLEPNVEYIELSGIDVQSGKELIEKIIPTQ